MLLYLAWKKVWLHNPISECVCKVCACVCASVRACVCLQVYWSYFRHDDNIIILSGIDQS